MPKSKQNMKVNKGIDKGGKYKGYLKRLEFKIDNWSYGLKDEHIKKLEELKKLICKVEIKEKDEFEEGLEEAYRLSQFFKNKKSPISEIKLSTALDGNSA